MTNINIPEIYFFFLFDFFFFYLVLLLIAHCHMMYFDEPAERFDPLNQTFIETKKNLRSVNPLNELLWLRRAFFFSNKKMYFVCLCVRRILSTSQNINMIWSVVRHFGFHPFSPTKNIWKEKQILTRAKLKYITKKRGTQKAFDVHYTRPFFISMEKECFHCYELLINVRLASNPVRCKVFGQRKTWSKSPKKLIIFFVRSFFLLPRPIFEHQIIISIRNTRMDYVYSDNQCMTCALETLFSC